MPVHLFHVSCYLIAVSVASISTSACWQEKLVQWCTFSFVSWLESAVCWFKPGGFFWVSELVSTWTWAALWIHREESRVTWKLLRCGTSTCLLHQQPNSFAQKKARELHLSNKMVCWQREALLSVLGKHKFGLQNKFNKKGSNFGRHDAPNLGVSCFSVR